MFKNNTEQYINVLKQAKQLKVDYTTVQNKKIIKQENSTFIIQTSSIPDDAVFKLNTLQKNISHSYITSLYSELDQHIKKNEDIDTNIFKAVTLDDKYSIVIPNKNITSFESLS